MEGNSHFCNIHIKKLVYFSVRECRSPLRRSRSETGVPLASGLTKGPAYPLLALSLFWVRKILLKLTQSHRVSGQMRSSQVIMCLHFGEAASGTFEFESQTLALV